jgi:hypothetical protein
MLMLLLLYRPYVSWETFMISAEAEAGGHLFRFVDDHGFFNGQLGLLAWRSESIQWRTRWLCYG